MRAFPDQPFVLDHIAKPPVRDGLPSSWREQIRELAALPNVVCKVSGMITEADWERWRPDGLRDLYLDTVFEAFGPDRLMYGSGLAGGAVGVGELTGRCMSSRAIMSVGWARRLRRNFLAAMRRSFMVSDRAIQRGTKPQIRHREGRCFEPDEMLNMRASVPEKPVSSFPF